MILRTSRDIAGALSQLDMFLRIGIRLMPDSDGTLETLVTELKVARDAYESADTRFWEAYKSEEAFESGAGAIDSLTLQAADARNAACAALAAAIKKLSTFLNQDVDPVFRKDVSREAATSRADAVSA